MEYELRDMDVVYAIGIDLGGTPIKYAIVSSKGEVLWENRRPTEGATNEEQVIKNLVDSIEECKSVARKMRLEIVGLGLGTPGLIDGTTGTVKGGTNNILGWENLPLASVLSKETRLSIYVDNDANLMALGEYIFGGHTYCNNILFLTIGTGIGGAIIIDGEIYKGANAAAGELGALVMNHEDKVGYWEDFASTSAMLRKYARLSGQQNAINGEYLFEKYFDGKKMRLKPLAKTPNSLEWVWPVMSIFSIQVGL